MNKTKIMWYIEDLTQVTKLGSNIGSLIYEKYTNAKS
jgi:hypothetical protein